MAASTEFIEYIIDQLEDWNEVSYKKMFGGAGLYAENKVFALVANDVIYMKVDDTNREMFQEQGCEPFKPFPDKPTVMSYYELPEDMIENREMFAEWAEISLLIQLKTEVKKKKKSR